MSFTFKVFILVSLLCLGTSKGSSNKERAHTNLCPLGVTGPGEDLFLLEPKPLSADLFLSGRCSSIQFLEEGVPTCCQVLKIYSFAILLIAFFFFFLIFFFCEGRKRKKRKKKKIENQ